MTISLKHKKTLAQSDSANTALARPSDWNDTHDLLLATAKLVGRTSGGDGAAEEIAVGATLLLAAASLAMNLANANEWTAAQNFNQTSLTSSAAHVAWAMSTNQVAYHTLTESTTLDAPSGALAGGVYILILKQHASSAKTLAFNSAYKWPGGTVPVLSSTVGYTDVMTVIYDGAQYNCVYQNGVR